MKRGGTTTLALVTTAVAVATAAIGTASMWRHPANLASSYDWRYFQTTLEAARRSLVWFAQVPLYNPWMCGGEPQLANPQSLAGSPAMLFVVLFGVALGQKLMLLAFVAAGIDGSYRLARSLSLSFYGAATAAASFGLCGWIVLHFGIGHVSFFGGALIPHLLWTYVRAKDDLRFTIGAGVVLAVIVAQGGNSTAAMAGIALSVVAVADALVTRRTRPLLILVAAALVGVALAAYRLFPAAEFAIVHPRHTTENDRQGLAELVQSAFTLLGSGKLPGHRYAIHEYGWRLPFLAWPLALLGVVACLRRPRPPATSIAIVLVLTVTGIGIALGDTWPYGPWWIMRQLPVLRDLRVPSRYVLLAALALSLCAGIGADWLSRAGKAVGLLVLAVVAIDAAVYANHHLSTVFALAPPVIQRSTPFYQVKGHYSRMLELVFANHGVIGCDEEAPLTRAAQLDMDDVPQVRLEDATIGTARVVRWSPNQLDVQLELTQPTRPTLLLVNLNWNEHWHSDDGEVVRFGPKWPADRDGGRLALRLTAPRSVVHLRYLPRSFVWGVIVSALALLGSLYLVRRLGPCDGSHTS